MDESSVTFQSSVSGPGEFGLKKEFLIPESGILMPFDGK